MVNTVFTVLLHVPVTVRETVTLVKDARQSKQTRWLVHDQLIDTMGRRTFGHRHTLRTC